MARRLIILLLLFPISNFAQSNKVKRTLKKIEFNMKSFDSSQPIMVDRLDYDQTNLSGEFENALFGEGFEVISNRVASEIIEFNNPNNKQNNKITIEKYTGISAVYVLTVSGSTRWDTGCGGSVPNRVTGRIIDMLNDGKLIGTFRFKQGQFSGVCANVIAEAVALKLRNL